MVEDVGTEGARELQQLLLEAAEMIHALRWNTDGGKAPPVNAGHAADQLIADLLAYRRRLSPPACENKNPMH
jgi:hypothetical protein